MLAQDQVEQQVERNLLKASRILQRIRRDVEIPLADRRSARRTCGPSHGFARAGSTTSVLTGRIRPRGRTAIGRRRQGDIDNPTPAARLAE